MKKEFIIPVGTKATMYQDGDKVVIEYEEKFQPKNGDFVKLEALKALEKLINK